MTQDLFPALPTAKRVDVGRDCTFVASKPIPARNEQFEIFPDVIQLRRIDPAKRMNRFYRMVVQRDLFGGVSLIREWGRNGQPGQVRINPHEDEGTAIDDLMAIMRSKRKRGYVA